MPHLTILQFRSPADARTMVMHNPIYASHMPCRIAVVEDGEGRNWLMMLNLEMLINSKLLPQDVAELAIRVNQTMLDIMVAGADGAVLTRVAHILLEMQSRGRRLMCRPFAFPDPRV